MAGYGDDDDGTFEVVPGAETVVASPAYEGANVCRVAALSTRFGGDQGIIQALSEELREFGFSERVISAEQNWQEADPRELFSGLAPGDDTLARVRRRTWGALNETGGPHDAVGFLVAMLVRWRLAQALDRKSVV